MAALLTLSSCGSARQKDYFQMSVVDDSTGRGVPLVELTPLNSVRYYTDSNGVIAFYEPHLTSRRWHGKPGTGCGTFHNESILQLA